MGIEEDQIFINNMKIYRHEYMNALEWLEIIVSGDQVAIDELKKKIVAVKKYNEQLETSYKACTEAEKKEMIRMYKKPKVDDAFVILHSS